MKRYLPVAVILLMALIMVWGWNRHERQVGALNLRIAQLEQHKTQVDTFYKTQTKTLVKVRHHTDSLLIADTVIKTDTVRVLIAAERKACDQVVQTCEQRVAVRDSLIKELKKKKPSILGKIPWLVGGYLIHEVIH